jgi:hypothetical protein
LIGYASRVDRSTWLLTAVFVPLIAFVSYRRVRRTFGRQPVAVVRMMVRALILAAVAALFLVVQPPTAAGASAAAAAAAVGFGLAMIGYRHTTFEIVDGEAYYVPNKWIGIVLTALFLGRLVARFVTLPERRAQLAAGEATPLATMQRSTLTVGLFFLFAAYYIAYYACVLRAARKLRARAPAPPERK